MLNSSNYTALFRHLIKSSELAREAFTDVYGQQVKKEVCATRLSEGRVKSLMGELSMDSLETFHWSEVLEDCRDKMPFTTATLQSAFPGVSTVARQFSKGRRNARRS